MDKFKIISFCLLSFAIGGNVSSMDKPEESILYSACIHKYSDNQDEETETFFPDEKMNPEQLMEELSKIKPIHVNLIERELGDFSLTQLIPYSHLIYGLSLSDNFFTNESLGYLVQFPEIRYINLANNSFNYPSLDCLLELNHLNHLNLTYNRIDPSQIDAIRKKMPSVEIVF